MNRIVNKIEITVTAKDLTGPVFDETRAKAKALGEQTGDEFSEGVQDAVQDAGKDVGDALGDGVDDGLKDTGDKGVADFVGRTKTKTEQGAKESGDGMSKAIVGALVGAAAIGPAAILAGLGVAAAGAVGYFTKSNAAVAADYSRLGATVSTELTHAAAPLAGTVNQALLSLTSSAKGLEPVLASAFTAAGPDITSLTAGVEGFTSGALTGVSQALASSQADVAGFANGLTSLGSGVGSFLTGLTRDSATTGAGFQSLLGVVSNTLGTAGSVIGSFSSAASTDLLAVDPVVNTLLSSIRAVSSPATIGGVAGLFGAMKLDPSISAGLGRASVGLSGLSEKLGDGTAMGERFSGAALKSAGALDTAAGVMSGPWGMAIGAGVGLLSGFVGSLIQASHASDALTLSQQGLTSAVAADGGNAGVATTAYIAQQAASDGLAQSAAAAGVSMATWTQAVIGNKTAQDQVTASVDKLNQAQDNATAKTAESASGTSHATEDLAGATAALDGTRAATDALTDRNAQLVNSMHAQAAQVADAITKQDQLNAATNTLANSQNILNATFSAAHTALVASAQQTASTAVGALNLGVAQQTLNTSLYGSVSAYTQAASEGSAYGSVLTALNGTENSLLGTEAAFTTSLAGVSAAARANGTSLDVQNAKGAANITVFTNLATAAGQAAVAVYQNEVATKGASQAYTDANAKLAQERNAFEAAAEKAGFNKMQVQALAAALYKLPANIKIPIWLDTSPATAQWHRLVEQIDGSTATIQVNTASGQIRIPGHATGGVAGGLTTLSEQGPEAVRLPSGSTVMTAADTRAALGKAASGPASPVQVQLVGGGSGMDGALGRLVMQMVREGHIQLKVANGRVMT